MPGPNTSKRWKAVRKRLAKASDAQGVLEALSTNGAGDGRVEDLWLDATDELWDKHILPMTLRELAAAVAQSDGVKVQLDRGKVRQKRASRMKPAEIAEASEKIVAVVKERPGCACSEIAERIGLDRTRTGKLLGKLHDAGELRREGERGGAVYFPA